MWVFSFDCGLKILVWSLSPVVFFFFLVFLYISLEANKKKTKNRCVQFFFLNRIKNYFIYRMLLHLVTTRPETVFHVFFVRTNEITYSRQYCLAFALVNWLYQAKKHEMKKKRKNPSFLTFFIPLSLMCWLCRSIIFFSSNMWYIENCRLFNLVVWTFIFSTLCLYSCYRYSITKQTNRNWDFFSSFLPPHCLRFLPYYSLSQQQKCKKKRRENERTK